MSATPSRDRNPFHRARSGAFAFALLGVLAALASSNSFYAFLHSSSSSNNNNKHSASSSCKCPSDVPSSSSSSTSDALPFTGVVEDCCCDYETVNSLNDDVVYPLLQRLVRTPFFRYFKVKLWCDCPHWPDDGMCQLRDCSVCECPDGEFPSVFKAPPKTQADPLSDLVQHQGGVGENVVAGRAALGDGDGLLRQVDADHGDLMSNLLPLDSLLCQEGKPASAVDRTLDTTHTLDHWVDSRDNPWTFNDETQEDGITYVNLLFNPERFTGYTGASARRIWDAIYQENIETASIQERPQEPLENRVIYKLISGLHSSISIQIAADYLLNEKANVWGPNPALLDERVLQHPARVRNLYFAYLFVLRAVTKAADYLDAADYDTRSVMAGSEDDEAESTRVIMMELLNNMRMKEACPKPFDEVQLWGGAEGGNLLLQVQRQFRNISSLMDCVGCEKCRLWGKLQVLGLGTALEILFAHKDGTSHSTAHPYRHLHLHRNEVIALLNLLNKLSESIHLLRHFEFGSDSGLPLSSHFLSPHFSQFL